MVVIANSGRYEETLAIEVPAHKRVELRADNHCRPSVVLTAELTLTGGEAAEIVLDGLLVSGAAVRVPAAAGNELARLRLRHCTLVPGLALEEDATPQQPTQASVRVEIADLALTIERSIIGALRIHPGATMSATDSIVDATAVDRMGYADLDDVGAGGALRLVCCTVIGKVHALSFPLVSNSVLLTRLASADTLPAPVIAERRQEGCVRFSYLPRGARVPRRFHCWPESASSPAAAVPRFTSLRYGFPAYMQLATTSGAELLTGADNEGQPGAFNFLFQPQRESNLRVRLDEYLRTGLEAGILFAS